MVRHLAINKKISLATAINFHGHLGPYLVLGLKAGDLSLKLLKAKKHFGIKVKVFGFDKKPKSCIIDGLQLSTGATYGKGNIERISSLVEYIEIINRKNNKRIVLRLNKNSKLRLAEAVDHKTSEALAKEFFKTQAKDLFAIIR